MSTVAYPTLAVSPEDWDRLQIPEAVWKALRRRQQEADRASGVLPNLCAPSAAAMESLRDGSPDLPDE